MLSLPNGNLFFLLPTFLFQQKNQMKKRIPYFLCRTAISFSFAYFSFSAKKPNEKENSILSLPNGNLFFLLPTFLFQQKNQMKKRIPYFLCRTAISFSFACFFSFFSAKKNQNEKENSILSLPNGNLFFLLPTFLFQQKNQMKKRIPYFLCRTAISFFFCLLFFFQQKNQMKKRIPYFLCRTAISFFFCLLFFFQQKKSK